MPSVRKWYLPQRLYSLYDWRQEQYSNYARDHYERYTEVFLEGSPFYDVYGNYITQGWLVYDWTEDYPEDNGSIITKNPRFRSWFNNLLVSSSHSGQFYSALMVGDGIRTTLTPLTFSKPRFDGIQWDLTTDKYALTMLSSRVSNTGEISSSEVGGGRPGQYLHRPDGGQGAGAGRGFCRSRRNLCQCGASQLQPAVWRTTRSAACSAVR